MWTGLEKAKKRKKEMEKGKTPYRGSVGYQDIDIARNFYVFPRIATGLILKTADWNQVSIAINLCKGKEKKD